MSSERCRIVTKTTKEQCKNIGRPEFAGFCRVHAPMQEDKLKKTWKEKLETGALAITYAQVVYQLLRVIIPNLPELFGSGGSSLKAKHFLENELFDEPVFLKFADSYSPGSRVDWDGLKEIYLDVKDLEDRSNEVNSNDLNRIYSKVDNWFTNLNDYHKNLLFEAIEDFKEEK
ncbi:hypothetical protein [Flavobacterium sp. UBA7680]|uniref:hypothetical protein n=1 Tax=Flavobacterium sp. UBA7680 TaxID=1946559 RepID=UPI0025B8D99E|nr:hypothetical protein [Flavobacterium sp. UBA7680]